MTIYKNKEEALEARNQFLKEMKSLQEKYSVVLDDDSGEPTPWMVEYIDQHGFQTGFNGLEY